MNPLLPPYPISTFRRRACTLSPSSYKTVWCATFQACLLNLDTKKQHAAYKTRFESDEEKTTEKPLTQGLGTLCYFWARHGSAYPWPRHEETRVVQDHHRSIMAWAWARGFGEDPCDKPKPVADRR